MLGSDEKIIVYCPECGTELKVTLKHGYKYQYPYGEVVCDECDKTITVEDRASFDQEGTIEVVFH